jgi:hypothetical protein
MSRRLVTDPRPRWHVPVAALVAVALLAGAFLVGHFTAGGTRARTVTVNAGPGPGPARTVDGIPVGYTHNEAGAIAFATNWLAANGTLASRLANVGERREFESLTMTPALRPVAGRQLQGVFSEGAVAGAAVLTVPLGYQVVSFSADAARIAVWSLTSGGNAATLESHFGTGTLWLSWEGGDWKLAAFGVADGPVLPAPRDQSPSASAYVVSQIAQVGRLRYAP